MLYLSPLNWYSRKSIKIKGSQKVVIYSPPCPRQKNLLENSLGKDWLGRISRAVGEEIFFWPLPKRKGCSQCPATTQIHDHSMVLHCSIRFQKCLYQEQTGPFCRKYRSVEQFDLAKPVHSTEILFTPSPLLMGVRAVTLRASGAISSWMLLSV